MRRLRPLNILAAGPNEAVEAVQPLLALMGQKIWRLGERGNGPM